MRLDRQVAQAYLDERILALCEDGKERYHQDFARAFGLGPGRHEAIKSRLRILEEKGMLTSRPVRPDESHAENGHIRRYFRKKP